MVSERERKKKGEVKSLTFLPRENVQFNFQVQGSQIQYIEIEERCTLLRLFNRVRTILPLLNPNVSYLLICLSNKFTYNLIFATALVIVLITFYLSSQ